MGSGLKIALVYDLQIKVCVNMMMGAESGPPHVLRHALSQSITKFSDSVRRTRGPELTHRKMLIQFEVEAIIGDHVIDPNLLRGVLEILRNFVRCSNSISSGRFSVAYLFDAMSADGEATLSNSWSDLLQNWPAESETILKFGEKMLGTFGLWALTQPFFDLDAKNREAEPGVAFWNGGPIIEPTQKNLSAIRQDPCQADACCEAETVIQVLDRLFSKVELEGELFELLWQCRLVALDLQVIASLPPLEPVSQ